jgi:acyl transferase domain-containing protein
LFRLHGSGTSIGDALELEALNLGLSAAGAQRASCVVGSNKGNLGNCEVSCACNNSQNLSY